MPDTTSKKGGANQSSLYFGTDSQIVGELGERLVTNSYVALAELIKNAYDADSPNVTIELNNISTPDAADRSIVIRDSGHGMKFEDVDKYWMMIATSNKLDNPVSQKYGRPKTGNKGVGRFSCQKLARELRLTSVAKVKGGYERTVVDFKWSDFKPGTDLNTIPCKYSTEKIPKGQTGVTLELLELRDVWKPRDFSMLLKNIALLSTATSVRRPGKKEDPGFNIDIKSNEYESESEVLLGDKVLNSGWGKLTGEISESGTLKLTLHSKDESIKKLTHQTKLLDLAGINFIIYIIPGDSRFDYIDSRRNTKLLTKKIRNEILDKQSGIKIYYDGFRVYPYGDIATDDDWLGLARDIGKRNTKLSEGLKDAVKKLSGIPDFNPTRALLNYPAAKSHIGSIHISGKATKVLVPKMDREGLNDNDAFKEFKRLIRLSTDWSALNYEAFIRNSKSNRNEILGQKLDQTLGIEQTSTKDRIETALEVIKQSVKVEPLSNESSLKAPIKLEKPQKVDRALEYIDSQIDTYSAELDTLRSVASTAPLMFVFSHEVKGIITSLINHSAKLEHLASQTKDESLKGELLEMSEEAQASVDRYGKLIKIFDVFSDSQNFMNQNANIKDIIDSVISGFEFLLHTFSITITTSEINRLLKSTILNESQVYSLIINGLTNSIKAVIVKNTSRNIHIDVNASDTSIYISIFDTGVGIKKENRTRVFKPFESDPENKIYSALSNALGDEQLTTLGKGSGLGLHIMKSIVEGVKGTIEFIDCDKKWKTCLKMEIPRK